jgi:hypothetical protein
VLSKAAENTNYIVRFDLPHTRLAIISPLMLFQLNYKSNRTLNNIEDHLIECYYMPHRNSKDLEQLELSIKLASEGHCKNSVLNRNFNRPLLYNFEFPNSMYLV